MHKIFLATFFAFVALSAAWDTDCTLRNGLQGSTCQKSAECAEGLSCMNGLCSIITFGSSCSADTDCGGEFGFCIGGVCDAKRIPGDPCTSSGQCLSANCSNGLCIAKSQGQACSGSDCGQGLWCDPSQGTCQQRISDNGDCGMQYGMMIGQTMYRHDLSLMCSGSSICNAQLINGSYTGTCSSIFSSQQNGFCSTDLGKYQCGMGLSCVNMTCQNEGSALCSDITPCKGLSEYCFCQSTSVLNGGNNGNNGNNGDNGDNGVSVGGDNGVNADDNGASVGGDNGVNANDNGVSVGGDNGANAGDNGVSVGGDNGVNIGDGGVSVGGDNGVNIGKASEMFGETFGTCLVDQCQSDHAQDYYSCLLQNNCGLETMPVLIANTCASRCLSTYRELKCCQAGINTSGSQNNNNSENGRLVVLNPQITCQNIPSEIQGSSSGAASVVASFLGVASLLVLAF